MVTKFAEGAAEAGGSRTGGGGESVQRGLAFGVRQRLPANVTGKTGKWPAKKGGGAPGGGRGGEGEPWTTAHCGWQSQSYWQSVPSAPSPVLAVGDFYIVCTIILSIQLEFDRRRRPQDTFVPGRNYIHLNAITVIRPGSEWAWLCSEHVH